VERPHGIPSLDDDQQASSVIFDIRRCICIPSRSRSRSFKDRKSDAPVSNHHREAEPGQLRDRFRESVVLDGSRRMNSDCGPLPKATIANV